MGRRAWARDTPSGPPGIAVGLGARGYPSATGAATRLATRLQYPPRLLAGRCNGLRALVSAGTWPDGQPALRDGLHAPLIEHDVDQPTDVAMAPASGAPLLPAILDAVADGVTVQEASGRLVYANGTALRMIGFESLAELLSASSAE